MLHRSKSKDAGTVPRINRLDPSITDDAVQNNAVTNLPNRLSTLKVFASSSPTKLEVCHDPHKAWTTEYLTDLRSYRPIRPSGSRPPPSKRHITSLPPSVDETTARGSSAVSKPPNSDVHKAAVVPDRCSSAMSHKRPQPSVPMLSLAPSGYGRPIVQQPSDGVGFRDVVRPMRSSMVRSSAMYKESGQRWVEKEEARALRQALEEMDSRDEVKLHAAAQDEASVLVWNHRNPRTPYPNPDMQYGYDTYIEQGSWTRNRSAVEDGRVGPRGKIAPPRSPCPPSEALDSSGSGEDISSASQVSATPSCAHVGKNDPQSRNAMANGHAIWDSREKKAYIDLAFPMGKPLDQPSRKRRSSGPKSRNTSGSLFRNPSDQIYEEPSGTLEVREIVLHDKNPTPAPLRMTKREPIPKLHHAREPPERSSTAPTPKMKPHSQYDIHKNAPSQSLNPDYTQNALPLTPPDSFNESDRSLSAERPLMKNGIEVRNQDIKAATSMRLKDRSPNLPKPTIVSNRPGRPIVSFDQGWKSKSVAFGGELSPLGDLPKLQGLTEASQESPRKPLLSTSTSATPQVPTINLPDQVHTSSATPLPTIQISNEASTSASTSTIPIIAIPDGPATVRPLPVPSATKQRPLPYYSSGAAQPDPSRHWSPSVRRVTAQCAACALPISGRIVSAASQRFHPHCFSCFQCGELLECVAFYPEPESFRSDRVARIKARAGGRELPSEHGPTEEEDGDESLRFYCHLDFHEKFSPRCRSCKTPIEGEVVVACGGDWHAGHFFCAECGDPFDAKTPFVERDGYAWCVECHTRKFSSKCAGCRKPVADMVVKALGREWHEACFCCKECGGRFEDGNFFTRGGTEDPVCVRCEETRLKA